MTKIRIGNDVNVVWRFRTPEGAAYPLTGEYTLLLINRWKREAISVFDVAGDAPKAWEHMPSATQRRSRA